MAVRAASEDDLTQLNDLYNHYVRETHITFDIEPITLDARREWFSHYQADGPHQVLVAVHAGRLLGFASSSRVRPKPAYDTSVETSIYLTPDLVGHGLGSRLYSKLFANLADKGLHRAYGCIALPNYASVALHKRSGFRAIGVFSEQGKKFGRYWDVAWFEKRLR